MFDEDNRTNAIPQDGCVRIGGSLTFENIKDEFYTGLEVAYDPGVWVVWTGFALILFGLYVTGALGWIADQVSKRGWDRNPIGRGYTAFVNGLARLLYTEGRVHVRADRNWGYFSSFLMGIVFSAGWIPCVGPVLAAIYLLASDTQTVAQGALLLLAYSAGLGIPFLITGAALGTATGFLRSLNRHMGVVSKITGLFLIFVARVVPRDAARLRGQMRQRAEQDREMQEAA